MSDELSNGNSNSKETREHKLLFWVPFILFFLISALFFTLSKSTALGWGLLLFFFLIIFLLRKFLSKFRVVYIICWVAIFIIDFVIYSYTLPGKIDNAASTGTPSVTTSVETKSVNSENLQFSDTYSFPDNKGSYVISVANDAKSEGYLLTITVSMPKEAIPDGFKWDANKVTETVTVGTEKVVAEDYVGVYWRSANSTPNDDNTNYMETLADLGKMSTDPSTLKGFKDTTFTRSAKSLEDLKKYMQTGDKLCLYWYNVKDVDVTQDADSSVRINYEQGYGKHPSIAEAVIPWNDIITELGI